MMFLMGKTDEHGTQHGEHIGLHESHQQFEGVHEQQHDDAEQVQAQSETYAHRPTKEYHTSETQYHGMACHHIGEKTDHQCEWLGEHTEQFDDGHDGHGISLQEQWHIGPEDFLPILSVAEQVDGQEGAESQEECDGNITCDVGSTREDG